MKNNNGFNSTTLIFIPLFLLILFPFPSKYIGYSMALWISDLVLMGYLLLIILVKKFEIPKTNTLVFFCAFLFLNLIGMLNSLISGNISSIRVIAEAIRSVEYIIIYMYFSNIFRIAKNAGMSIEELLKKNIIKIALTVFIISTIELFNLPVKELLRNFYDMDKSGNIYQYYNRIVGTLRNPNYYGIWLSFMFLFFYMVKIRFVYKIILISFSGFFLYFTGSRTSLLACLISLVTVIIINSVRLKKEGNSSILLLGFIALILFYVTSRFQDFFFSVRLQFDMNEWLSFGGRLEIWESYYEEFLANPLFGAGIQKSNDLIFDNTFVQYSYYYGIIGLVFVCIFFLRNISLNLRMIFSKSFLADKLIYFILGVQIVVVISAFTVQILDVLQISFFYLMSLAYLDFSTLSKSNDVVKVKDKTAL
jgi:O-antigen ligase